MSVEVVIQRTMCDADRQFDLDIELRSDSRRIVLYGPSGAGKSLTLRSIAGLLSPDRGRIVINERVLFDTDRRVNLPPQARRAGYLFQDYALFPHLTVAQNVAFGATRGVRNPGRRAKLPALAQRWLETLELEAIAHSYPGQISGGQKQRVALARALASQPDSLLLDEPFSALDPALKTRMRGELAGVQAQLDLQLILITHDPADAEALGEHVFEIQGGRVSSQSRRVPRED